MVTHPDHIDTPETSIEMHEVTKRWMVRFTRVLALKEVHPDRRPQGQDDTKVVLTEMAPVPFNSINAVDLGALSRTMSAVQRRQLLLESYLRGKETTFIDERGEPQHSPELPWPQSEVSS